MHNVRRIWTAICLTLSQKGQKVHLQSWKIIRILNVASSNRNLAEEEVINFQVTFSEFIALLTQVKPLN